jgi:pellino protein
LDPAEVITSLNAMKPQCPVLFNEIRFAYLDSKERAMNAIRRSADEHLPLVMPHGNIHIPATDYSAVNEESRSYVFPACGHVHGYHRSMVDKPCPFCRKTGPFTPIAFSFEPALCDKLPTHVFNPCGHVASLSACSYWSQIPLYSRNLPSCEMCAKCPFCATELSQADPFHRLMLQTETGETWPADCRWDFS